MAGTGYQPLSEIVTEIGQILQNESSDFEPRIIAAVNRRYEDAAESGEFRQLIKVDVTGLRDPADPDLKTIEGGQAEFPLPLLMGKLKSIQAQVSPELGTGMLEAMDPQAFFEEIGDRISQAGTPTRYCRVGETAQIRRLAADGAVTLKCDVNSNDAGVSSTTKTVRVHYKAAAASSQNDPLYRDVAGSFSVGISLGVMPAGFPIERVVLPAGWLGDIQILDSLGAKLVHGRHWQEPETTGNTDQATLVRDLMRCWPVPGGDVPCTISWVQTVRPLLQDNDTPMIPVSRWLVAAAAADLLLTAGRREDAKFWEQRASGSMVSLMTRNEQDAPRVATPRGGVLGSVGMRRRWW